MWQKALHSILSVTLAALLLFGSTAKEAIHLFAGHEDTTHCNADHAEGLSFETEHHHCDFLSFSLPVFNQDHQIPFITPLFNQEHFTEYTPFHTQLVQRKIIRTSLRGPPGHLA